MAIAAALIYPDQVTAEQALGAVRTVEKAGDATFLESGLVVKDQDGRIEIKQDGWKSEIVWGGAAGGVMGALLLGIPVLGSVGGALAGSYIWKHKDSQEAFRAFANQVKREMPPGGAALVALVESTNPDHIRAALGKFNGTLYSMELPPSEVAHIQAELDKHRQ